MCEQAAGFFCNLVVDCVEVVVNCLEAVVHCVEVVNNYIEVVVHCLEVLGDCFEATVDYVEALVDMLNCFSAALCKLFGEMSLEGAGQLVAGHETVFHVFLDLLSDSIELAGQVLNTILEELNLSQLRLVVVDLRPESGELAVEIVDRGLACLRLVLSKFPRLLQSISLADNVVVLVRSLLQLILLVLQF